MKIAKVVSVRDCGSPTEDAEPLDATARSHAEMADSLRRYPGISEAERRRLLRFLKRASRMEIRDAILRRGLEPRLLAFRKDHKSELRRGWSAWAPWIFLVLLLAELVRLLN